MMAQLRANEYQVGGHHYKTDYEHWDFVLATGQGYFEGNITRYIARWRKKNGGQDLTKALHYINKLLEWVNTGHNRLDLAPYWLAEMEAEVIKFSKANQLGYLEQQAISKVVGWQRPQDLKDAHETVLKIIMAHDAETPELPLPKPVPLTEENHYSPRAGAMADLQEDEE